MITLESFARRTPVVARDLGPLPEVIDESGGGLLFRDDAGLLAAVSRLAGEAGLRDELGRRGYEALLANWTREAHLPRYLELLEGAAMRKLGAVPWAGTSRPAAPIMEEAIA